MKNTFKILIVTLIASFISTSCEDYLEVPSDATLTEEVVFSEYKKFQGFLDPCYSMVADANSHDLVIAHNIGTESASNSSASPAYRALNMDYSSLSVTGRSIWVGFTPPSGPSGPDVRKQGLYHWWAIGSRVCNIALKNLVLLKDTLAGDKAKIEGQARFFRAYYNFEVARAYGSVPYLDEIYVGDDAQMPRYWTDEVSGKKDCQAVFEKCARDLRMAADLLPVEWEDFNLGRITKGAALSLLSKVLLHAGSPLYEESSVRGNSVVTADETAYNKTYLTQSAEAAAECIKLGKYELAPFTGLPADEAKSPGAGYRQMFTTIDGNKPYTKEIIFKRWNNDATYDRFTRIYAKGVLGSTVGGFENPLLRFMDKFEMIDGTQYKPGNTINGGYDDNFEKFTNQRDPRFQFNYRLHRETIGSYTTSFENKGQVYFAGAVGPFMMTKYWYPLADNVNKQFGKYTYSTPSIRYADLLLIYAEAVFEATGNPDASIGGVLTARQALNAVRNRAGMPDYNPATYAVARTEHGELASDDPFRLAVRNERCVELAYEGHLWNDLRRWKLMHRLEKQVWILDFNKEWTSVSRVVRQPFLFEMRNYWLPFVTEHTQIYEGFPQNPGW